MLVQSAWTGPPALARKLTLAVKPPKPRYAPLQVLFESGLIVRSDSGGPQKNVKDLKEM